MKKILVCILTLFILFPVVSAEDSDELNMAEIKDKINSIAHYAEEYEVGNINYLQLNVYGHKIRSELNLLMGGGIGEEWARIPKENVEKAFGPPTDYTNWLWVDNKHINKRFDDAMPWWERIVFDGRKIQIIFHAFPSAIEGESGEIFRYYSVDLNVKFKKKFQFDFDSMLGEVTSLAADYNLTRTRKSGEAVVEKMLETQRLLERYINENSEQCVEILEGFFKPEEKWPKQKMMGWKFPLFTGSDFDVMIYTDMCEECEWHHVNIMLMIEGRGPMYIFESPELKYGKLEHQIDEEYYWTLSIDEINQELKKAVFEVRDEAEKFEKTRSEDFPKKFFFNRFKVQQINRILDGKYNEVHDFDEGVARRIESGELQGPGGCENFDECRKYCDKQENIGECRKFMYNLRVDFLENMFSGYEIEKILEDQIKWERRLIENFETHQDSWCRHVNDLQCKEDEGCVDGACVPALGGNETCDNRADDDGDRVVDCQDPDCWQERSCGKLCGDVCNKEGGCWQTTYNLCAGVCKECWDCGGDETCRSVCEPECWPCHDQNDIKNTCDECWICEDESYGGCYVECKSCNECDTQRKEKIRAIFDRAAAGEIETPGGCMTEEECNRYCAEHGEECGEIMSEIGLYSQELDCNEECRGCTTCNYDLGNFRCNENQYFDRGSGYCVCSEGRYDCDGTWENGCEAENTCLAGACFEECEECDACPEGGECDDLCLDCYKCKNPDMPTYICDGVEQLKPCKIEYVCNGVKQKKPCEIYMCDGKEYTKPCDEINRTCEKNQIMAENKCICEEGFKDCDNDGNCESTKFCGLEICDDREDNNNDGLADCQDSKCDRQFCGVEGDKELLCINKVCIPPEEEIPAEPEPICGNHICENNESESCAEDCVVCEVYEPPECPNGKIVWKGKDNLGCLLPPVCVITDEACESNEDCPQPKCGISECIDGECRVIQLLTICEEGCKEGKTKKRACKDGSEITTAICSGNQWVDTGEDCPEVIGCVCTHEYNHVCGENGITYSNDCSARCDGVAVVCSGECPCEITPAPSPEPGPKCEEGKTETEKCGDGSEIIAKQCLNGEWIKTEQACPVPQECPPVCAIFCEYGNKLDGRGCPTCECNSPPKEKKPEEIAPEIEEEETEVRGECVLMNNCGGQQDVCSNGNCVTLPISAEMPEEPATPEQLPAEQEMTPEQPETPLPEAPQEIQQETPLEAETPPPETPAPPTGSVTANFIDALTGWVTGLFAGEENPCNDKCSPCDECNRKVDELMKKIERGEIQAPGGCSNRMGCEEYCWKEEHQEECNNFFNSYGIETIHCWDRFCRGECNTCRFEIGEFECKANQYFDFEESFCKCNEGWNDCDGDWENGCESSQSCDACQSKDDCAKDRCAQWGNVIQQFDCFKGEEWVQEKGVVRLEAACRLSPTKKASGWASFDMWGDPFESLHPIREEAEREIGWEWCEWELENNIKERIEIQNSFTENSLRWFFEEYMPSSPSEWEKHMGGIYDSYWRIVNNNEWTAENLLCSGRDKWPEEYKPIDVTYNTDFGSVRIWEVETTTDFFGKRMKILSPYMQIWVFPTKEFIKKEFQESMETGMMPGPERKKKPGFSPSEIEEMKKDKKLTDLVNSISNKYGGEAKFLFNIVDGNELVFNALITINPETPVNVEPMKTYEGYYDAKLTFDFDFFYSLIETSEKEVRGAQIEYPPWEKEGLKIGDMLKGVVDDVKMWFMINSGTMNGDIRSDPPDSLSDGLAVMKLVFEGSPP